MAQNTELIRELENIESYAEDIRERRGDYLGSLDLLVETANYWATLGLDDPGTYRA